MSEQSPKGGCEILPERVEMRGVVAASELVSRVEVLDRLPDSVLGADEPVRGVEVMRHTAEVLGRPDLPMGVIEVVFGGAVMLRRSEEAMPRIVASERASRIGLRCPEELVLRAVVGRVVPDEVGAAEAAMIRARVLKMPVECTRRSVGREPDRHAASMPCHAPGDHEQAAYRAVCVQGS